MSDRLRVLIVDDNPAMAGTLADILEVKGFDVHAVYCGAEALKLMQDHPVEVLLTDVKMPEMNGLELYQETIKSHPNVYTIFMTAYATDDLINEGRAQGIKVVLTKPLDINLLFLILASIHKTQHLSDEQILIQGRPGRQFTPSVVNKW
jgi:CheY-like chemotaxis protein